MTVHFAAAELARMGALEPLPALALALFTDERPLRGMAGLADWRLGGRLSRLLKSGRMTGRTGEVTLLPPSRRRLPFERLILFGLGESDHPGPFGEERYRDAVARMRVVLDKAGLEKYAIQPPGRATGLIAPRRALELWLEVAAQDRIVAEVTVIESASGQKEMSEALRARTRPERS
jgi:Cytosol aminopeptidase family, N-terminal domain